MAHGEGLCCLCGQAGEVGKPCVERVCQQRGYHYIPKEDATRARGARGVSPDPNIGLLFGDYLIVGSIGEGGFGLVYLALQQPIGMKAALKVLSEGSLQEGMNERMLRKFESEARSLALLNHPNIVRLLKFGTFDEMPYLVMEYVENARTLKADIAQRIVNAEPFEPEQTLHILRHVCNALNSAHKHNIVHRDIKPENIMLQAVEGDPLFVRILDFGLAKFVDQGGNTSIILGTPAYMAPEQLLRREIGPWTDLYAVGVIAFEMLTGIRPFAGPSVQDILTDKMDPSYDPTKRLEERQLPPTVVAFLRKSLAHAVDQRYRSAAEFASALAQVVEFLGSTKTMLLDPSGLAGLLDAAEIQRVTANENDLQRQRAELERLKRDHEQALVAALRQLESERSQLEQERLRLSSVQMPAMRQPSREMPAMRQPSRELRPLSRDMSLAPFGAPAESSELPTRIHLQRELGEVLSAGPPSDEALRPGPPQPPSRSGLKWTVVLVLAFLLAFGGAVLITRWVAMRQGETQPNSASHPSPNQKPRITSDGTAPSKKQRFEREAARVRTLMTSREWPDHNGANVVNALYELARIDASQPSFVKLWQRAFVELTQRGQAQLSHDPRLSVSLLTQAARLFPQDPRIRVLLQRAQQLAKSKAPGDR
ncbi:MAG: protein kinase [Myxococcales bacterium]|nr:protein kinase [Myxococcales bacterium]